MSTILEFPKELAFSNLLARQLNTAELGPAVINEARLREIPIIQEALFLLNEARGEKGIRLTKLGHINRITVRAFWDAQIRNAHNKVFRPSREGECRELIQVRGFLKVTGYLAYRKDYLVLSAKGQAALEQDSVAQLYRDLFLAMIDSWSWTSADRYPEFDFIQDSVLELIEGLLRWSDGKLTPRKFLLSSFEFPTEGLPNWSVRSCFTSRFFQRFCMRFGILRCVSKSKLLCSDLDRFERTDFFLEDYFAVLMTE